MVKRIALRALVAFGAITALRTATTAQEPPVSKPKAPALVGVCFSQATDDWHLAETKSIKDAAEKRNIVLRVAPVDAELGQVGQMRQLISQHVEAIVVVPDAAAAWEPELREAKKAGIPVVVLDSVIQLSDPELAPTYVAFDAADEGKQAALWLIGQLREEMEIRHGLERVKSDLNIGLQKMSAAAAERIRTIIALRQEEESLSLTLNTAEIQGPSDSQLAMLRHRGFNGEVTSHLNMRIVKSETADSSRSGGKAAMERLLRSDRGKFRSVFVHNDQMALGAIEALIEAKVPLGRGMRVVSVGGSKDALRSIAAGQLAASVEHTPSVGDPVFDVIGLLVAGKPVPPWVRPNTVLFDADVVRKLGTDRPY